MSNPTGPTNDHPLDDLAAHALDALDPAERRAVDEHLAGCAACRAELAGHHETLAALAPAEAPPPSVWQGIATAIGAPDLSDPHAPVPTTGTAVLDQLDSSPPSRAGGPSNGTAGTEADRTVPAGHGRDERGPTPPPVTSLTEARERRRPSSLRWLAAAACLVVVAAVAGAVGFVLGDSGEGGDIGSLAEQASQNPDGVLAILADGSGQTVAQVVADDDGAYLQLVGLQDLPEGQAYQLWSLTEAEPVSLGMLGRDGTNTVAFRLPPTITELAISVAPTSGDTQPNGGFQASGEVTQS